MEDIKITITLTIAKETIEKILETGMSKEDLLKTITDNFNENMGETIEDNEKLWATKFFEIK